MQRHSDAALAGQPLLLLAPTPFAAAATPRCVAAASPASGSAGEGAGAAAVVQSQLRPCGLEDGLSWTAAQRLQLRELAQQNESGWVAVAAMLPGTPRTAVACGVEHSLQRLFDSTLPLAFGGTPRCPPRSASARSGGKPGAAVDRVLERVRVG